MWSAISADICSRIFYIYVVNFTTNRSLAVEEQFQTIHKQHQLRKAAFAFAVRKCTTPPWRQSGVVNEPKDPSRKHWRIREGTMGKHVILGEVGSHAL
jgi:hypothetical protein